MKNLRKGLLKALFAAIAAVAMLASVSCAKDKGNEITFEGWTDEITVTAELGSYYEIPWTEITGSDGKTYYYDIVVTDSSGENTPVIAGGFDVEDVGGYTVSLSVEAGGKTRTRRIIINVKDVTAPEIFFGSAQSAMAGKEYTLPQITVRDDSGETITPEVKVFFKETEIKPDGNKFTPEATGIYTIKVSATDSSGNSATAEKDVEVRNLLGPGVFENFDDGFGLSSSKNGSKAELLDEYEGESGVLHVPGSSAEKTEYRFRLPGNAEDYKYKNIDKITFRLYILRLDEEGNVVVNSSGKKAGADVYDCDVNYDDSASYWSALEGGVWTEYTVENFEGKGDFISAATSDNGVRLFWTWTKRIELYIDEITYHATPEDEITLSATQVYAGEQVQVSFDNPDLTSELYVVSPDGVQTKIENGAFVAEKRGVYTVKAEISAPEYLASTITAEVTCLDKYVDADVPEFAEVNSTVTVPAGRLVDSSGNVYEDAEVTVSVKYDGEAITPDGDNSFVAGQMGWYTFEYNGSVSGEPINPTFYRMFVGTTNLTGMQIENFDCPESASSCTNSVTEWLGEHNGRFGVIQITQNDTTGYYFKTRRTAEQLGAMDWDVIEITLCSDTKRWLCYGNTEMNIQSTPDWMTISIPKDAFPNLISQITSENGVQLFWAWDTGNIYVDEIRFAKYSATEVEIPAEKTDTANGVSFTKDGQTYETETPLSAMPRTIEAWIYLDTSVNTGSVIFGNYTGYNSNPYLVAGVNENGAPYVRMSDGNDRSVDAVFDQVDVRSDKFIHIAFVLDNEQSRALCYINGGLKQIVTGFTFYTVPPSDVFVVGGDLRSGNHSCFLGKIAGISFFSNIRTQAEITEDISGVTDSAELMASYDMNGADSKTTVSDVAGNVDMMVRATWLDDIAHPDSYAYSFAVVGDTQSLIYKNPDQMATIYDWLAENRSDKKIRYVFGLGDITEFLYAEQNTATDNREKQWGVAKDAISRLDGVIPYTLVRGNHDSSMYFNSTFNNSAYMQNIDGTRDGKLEDSYSIFFVGDTKYMVVTLDFNPSSESLQWAGEIIAANSDCRVIITTHSYLHYNGQFTSDGGSRIWDELASKYPNIVLVLSGHVQYDFITTRTDTGDNGNLVTQVLIDPQDVDLNGPTGLVAMFYFDENGEDIYIEYFSTVKQKYFKQRNQIKITIDDSGVEAPETVDRTPRIYVGDMPLGQVGESYKLPEVTAYDADGNSISAQVKLYFNDSEVVFTGDSFVPDERGEYKLVITAADGDEVVKTIKVRTPVAEGLLEDFNDEYSIENANVGEKEWLETFKGKTGVLHIKANANDRSYYSLRLIDLLSDYPVQPFDSIKMTVYVNTENGGSGSFYDTTTEKYTGISNNKWTEFTITQFMDWQFFIGNAATDGGAILFNVWTKNIDIYIDEISFVATLKPELSVDKDQYVPGDTVTVSYGSNCITEPDATVTVYRPDGSSFILSENSFVVEDEGEYRIVLEMTCGESGEYTGTKTLTIEVLSNYFEFGEYEPFVTTGAEVTIPAAHLIDVLTGEVIEDAQITYVVKFEGVRVPSDGGKFTAEEYGYYEVVFTANVDGQDAGHGSIVIGSTTKLLDFMSEDSVAAVKNADVSYLQEYEGAPGVAKADFDNTIYTHLYFDFGITTEQLAATERDFIEIRMFVAGTSDTDKFQTYYASSWREWYQLNTWVKVRLSKDVMTDALLTADILSGAAELMQLQNATVTNVYIDYIDLAKYAFSSDGTERSVGFDSELDVGLVKCTTQEWMADYEGAKGVVKITYSDNWSGFRVNYNAVENLDATDFDYVVIRAYFKATAFSSQEGKVQILKPSSSSYWGAFVDVDQWVEVRFNRSEIGDDDLTQMLAGTFRTFGTTNATVSEVYIDYVDFVKEA